GAAPRGHHRAVHARLLRHPRHQAALTPPNILTCRGPRSAPDVITLCRGGTDVVGGAGLALYHDLRTGHTAWVQRIHAVLFHQGAPAFADLSRKDAPAELAALAQEQLSPAGSPPPAGRSGAPASTSP